MTYKKYKTKMCNGCGKVGDVIDIDGTPVCGNCGQDTTKHVQSWDDHFHVR